MGGHATGGMRQVAWGGCRGAGIFSPPRYDGTAGPVPGALFFLVILCMNAWDN